VRPLHPLLQSVRAWRSLSGPQLLAGSFLLLIALGTVGFKTLPGLYTGDELGWLDALFTATSAVCVTGLIVVDTATYFTTWGQAYVLLLIQLGGLGVITFSTLLLSALGRRLSLRQEDLSRSAAGPAAQVDHRRLTRHIVVFTLAVEAAGALLLYLLWIPDFGARGAVWPAVFHSVSAFCNAGFSTFSDSLVGFDGHTALLSVVMALIVVGGIGFLLLEELLLLWRASRAGQRFRLSVHSRLVLATSAALVGGGWVLFTVFEWQATLAGMPVVDRLTNGLFLSVTARTAGFNTVDYGAAASNTNFLTILLMSIGGSPGSTAGGLKTTTVALIGLLAWARLRGDDRVILWGRSVPEATVQRAVGLFVIAFGIVTAAIFLLTSTELTGAEQAGPSADATFLPFMFEAASAFNTVGLSMGVTADLSTAGRWVIILLMFVGRIGALTFAAALARRLRRVPFRYAYEDVGVG
jgi:trk system potassium uptake protein TrkH